MVYFLTFILLSLIFSVCARAQWSFDFTSVEAYINDHKTQRSLLLTRATLEQSNAILHSYSADAAQEHRELNADLDQYTRAFDVIDVVYQSVRTGMNVYTTYEGVTETVGKYKDLLLDYKEAVRRKGVEATDTVIISIALHGIDNIAGETQQLYRSVSDLIVYASGAAACSTANLMLIFESINRSLDRIEAQLNKAYFDTWRYIQVRKGYWKRSVYRLKTRQQLVNEAFARWKRNTQVEMNP